MDRDILKLEDIRKSIAKIRLFTEGLNLEEFIENDLVKSGVMAEFTIIGEASKSISVETKEKYGSVPWQKVAGLRDILVHHYFEVDWKLIWDTITINLPELESELSPTYNQTG